MGRSAEDPSTDRPQGRTDASARARARRIGHRAPAAVGVRAALVRAFARTCAYAVRLNNAAEGRAHIVHAPSWWNQGGSPRSKAFTVLSAAPRDPDRKTRPAEAKNLECARKRVTSRKPNPNRTGQATGNSEAMADRLARFCSSSPTVWGDHTPSNRNDHQGEYSHRE